MACDRPTLVRLLRTTGFDRIVSVTETVDEGMAALTGQDGEQPAADRPRPAPAPAECLIPPGRDGRLDRMGLSERDRAILEFEGSWWTGTDTKEAAIKARLGLSASRYRQILAVLVDSDEAAAVAPLVVRRLRRDRNRRRRARYEGRPAGGRKGF